MRYAFGIGSILMQEAIVYMHAVLFMMAAADTLLAEAHVRVDIFYARLPAARKAMVDLLGNALLVLPFCVLLFLVSIDYVRLSWSVLERLPRNQRHSSSVSSEKRDFGFRCPTGIASRVGHDQSRPPPARPEASAS